MERRIAACDDIERPNMMCDCKSQMADENESDADLFLGIINSILQVNEE